MLVQFRSDSTGLGESSAPRTSVTLDSEISSRKRGRQRPSEQGEAAHFGMSQE